MKPAYVFYQLSLRAFTPEGTLNAAAEMLPYLRDLGVDYVYLCPMFKADIDEDRSTWSRRQLASKTENPKNPYKIIDYFTVDEEYGTNEDLIAFIAAAHKVGLRVMLDLVYLHCGKNSPFIAEHPDWVEQDETGKPIVGATWPFARINYKSQGVRDYLKENMRMFVVDYGCDGFRCDVGDAVPLDFWEEAVAYVSQFRSDFLMFDEGSKVDYVKSVFDLAYARYNIDGILNAEKPAEALAAEIAAKSVYMGKNMNMMENHDIASDTWPDRREIKYGGAWVDAFHCLMYTLPGHVLIWNGNEMADRLEQNMFANRFYSKRIGINWSMLYREEGKARHDLIADFNRLVHEYPCLTEGEIELLSAPEDKVLRYTRTGNGVTLNVTLNLSDEPQAIPAKGEILLVHNADGLTLNKYGFLITKG